MRKGLPVSSLIFSSIISFAMKTTKQPVVRLEDLKALALQPTAQLQVKGGSGQSIIIDETII